MSECDNKSFLQLLLSEIRRIICSPFSKPQDAKPDEPAEEETVQVRRPAAQQAPKEPVPEPVQASVKGKAPQKSNEASAEDRLQALFSGKMQARDQRRKNAVRKGDLQHRKLEDGNAQEPLLEEDEEDEAPIGLPQPRNGSSFQMPPLSIFASKDERHQVDMEEIVQKRGLIQDCLDSFLVDADVGEAVHGPRVTMYKVHVADGVMVSNVTKYEDEIRMRLSAETLRILAPVPGYDYIGIEVLNREADTVRCGSIMASQSWSGCRAAVPLVMGRDIAGQDCIMDLAKAPHLLVAG
ncbi:MAG: hypothetical protein J5746_08020, partial [Victivallales bacterium]|nr:hypothetical protein [Victivallales bacterium]